MEADPALFRDLAYIFLAATAGGFLAWWLRLPLVIGYVFGGLLISPFTPGLQLSDPHAFQIMAEVGVVLLMFSIGVEFSVADLMRVKWVAIGGGIIGITLSIAFAVAATWLAGWGIIPGVVIGATISVASTMVLARLLSDRGAMTKTYGRVSIGITLVEDLAVVFMTILLPVFSGSEGGRLARAGWVLGKAFILLIPLALVTLKVIPDIFRRTKATKDPELFLLVAIAICLGTAALAHAVGFSVALGAFLAGLAISGSEDLHHAHAQLIPLRDAFVALFFVTLGALVDPRVILNNLPLLGVMLLLIVVGKFLIWMTVLIIFRYSIWTAIATAAGLTQIGELSFVIVQTAKSAGMVKDEVFSVTLAASLLSILLNVFIVRAALAWVGPKLRAEAT